MNTPAIIKASTCVETTAISTQTRDSVRPRFWSMEDISKLSLLDIVDHEPACTVLGGFLSGMHACMHSERIYRLYSETKDIDAFNAGISSLKKGLCPLRGAISCDSMNAVARAHRRTLLLKYFPWAIKVGIAACSGSGSYTPIVCSAASAPEHS